MTNLRVTDIEVDTDNALVTANVNGEEIIIDLTRKVGEDILPLVERMVHLLGRKLDTAVADNCMECIGACCTEWRINVDSEDVDNLARGLGIPVAEVDREYIDPSFDLSGGGRSLQLRHVADSRFPGETRCKLLTVTPGTKASCAVGRCSVYEHRPKTCREYPAHGCEQFVPATKLVRGDTPRVEKT